jgi:hypothetical protein
MKAGQPAVPARKRLAIQAQQQLAAGSTEKPKQVGIPLSPVVLGKLGEAMPALRELARFAGGPRYQAYFRGGKPAQVTKTGNLSIVQHDGKRITETAKLRNLRPGQIANLGFSFVTVVVGMEHMARIDRQLARMNNKLDEIAAMLADDLVAPIRDVAGSIHRFTPDGIHDLPQATAEAWVRDLRRVRQRLVSKIERLPSEIQPSTSFWWGSQVEDLKAGAVRMAEAGQLIEMLASSDAMLYRMATSLPAPWALDGVDRTVAVRLARDVATASNALMNSTDKDCSYDATGKRQLERNQVLGNTQRSFHELIEHLIEADRLCDASLRLLDERREFCITIENDRILALHEVTYQVEAGT